MAAVVHHLTTGSNSAGSTTYATDSIAPNPSRLIVAAVMVSSAAPTPTVAVTGCGVTWVPVASNATGTQPIHGRTIHLFRAMGSPTAGALTITADSALTAALWQVIEVSGVDTSGTSGSGAVVQSVTHRSDGVDVTSDTKAFGSPITAGNATYAAIGLHSVQEALTAGAGWTTVAQTTVAGPQSSFMGEFAATGQQNIAASWTTATDDMMVGVEIKAATGDSTAPSAPASIAVVANSATSVGITWTASTDDTAVVSYRVRRDGVDLPGATAVAGLTFTDNTVSGGNAYSYTSSAVDAAGNRSPESIAATITTPVPSTLLQVWNGTTLVPLIVQTWNGTTLVPIGAAGAKDTTAPSRPTGVTAVAVSPTRVDMSWNLSTDNVAVEGYRVRRNGQYLDDATGGTYTDTTVGPSSPYSYTVQAYDEDGNDSPESAAVSVTTPAPADTAKPSVPTGLSATADSPTTIGLSWNPSTDNAAVSHYVVLRGGTVVNSRVTGTSYISTGLAPSTSYGHTVQAVDSSGNVSNESATATATTLADTSGGGGTPTPSGGFIIGATAAQIQSLPKSGAEWTRLKQQADGPYNHIPGDGAIDGSGNCVAGALVYVATGDTAYRNKVIAALNVVENTSDGAWQHAAVSRKLGGWALASNLVGHNTTSWRAFLLKMLSFNTGTHGRTTPLSKAAWHWDNNHGGAAMLAYITISAVLGLNSSSVTVGGVPGGLYHANRWLRGFCGDRSSTGFGHSASTNPSYGTMGSTGEAVNKGWHMDEARPYGIGPTSAMWGSAVPSTREGAVPSDAVRGTTANHPTVGADGHHYVPGNAGRRTGAAVILAAQGYPDIWTVGDHALYRWRAWMNRMYGGIEGTAHFTYDPIIKKVYGRRFDTSQFNNVSQTGETWTGTEWLSLIPSWPVRPSTLA